MRAGPGRTLSGGVVVEASVVARLLGLKLLRLKADVTLLPATVEHVPVVAARAESYPDPAGVAAGTRRSDTGSLSDAVELLAHATRTLRDARAASS